MSEVYGPEMEWGWSDEFPDLGPPQVDPAERSERMMRWLGSWQDWCIEAQDYIAQGDLVVVLCRYTGRGRGSGVALDELGAHVWTLREGRATRLEIFSSRERAMREAGITAE